MYGLQLFPIHTFLLQDILVYTTLMIFCDPLQTIPRLITGWQNALQSIIKEQIGFKLPRWQVRGAQNVLP